LPVVHQKTSGSRYDGRNTISSGIGSAFRAVRRRTDHQISSYVWKPQM
jgi:hypothetical protein